MLAMLVRFLFPADESRIDLIFDWPDLRFSKETEIAEWII